MFWSTTSVVHKLYTTASCRSSVMHALLEPRGEAIMLVKLSIILFSNSHNLAYYAHRFYLLFSKLCLA